MSGLPSESGRVADISARLKSANTGSVGQSGYDQSSETFEGDEIANADDAIRKDLSPHPSATGERLRKSRLLHQGGWTIAGPGWLGAAHSDIANSEFSP